MILDVIIGVLLTSLSSFSGNFSACVLLVLAFLVIKLVAVWMHVGKF